MYTSQTHYTRTAIIVRRIMLAHKGHSSRRGIRLIGLGNDVKDLDPDTLPIPQNSLEYDDDNPLLSSCPGHSSWLNVKDRDDQFTEDLGREASLCRSPGSDSTVSVPDIIPGSEILVAVHIVSMGYLITSPAEG